MPLSPGSRLGPYEILTPLGAGGLGEVYRARDPHMGRQVAIKVSAERFSDRFECEVHAVAALNHQAWVWFEKAYEERASWLADHFNVDPRLDGFRSDPRYQDLLRRMGLGS